MMSQWFMDIWWAIEDFRFWVGDEMCIAASPLLPEVIGKYCTRFYNGLVITVQLSALAFLLGTALAAPIAWIRLYAPRSLRAAAAAYMYCLRGTPLLVQLWLLYFGIGSIGRDELGIWWAIFGQPYYVGLLALTLNTSAYSAEIIRGGLANTDAEQIEAARAIGMSPLQIARCIHFPQAFAIAWPAYTNELILLVKGSALVSTITVFDLMGVTRTVFARNYDLGVFFAAAVLYLLVVAALTLLMRQLETRKIRAGIAPS